MKYSSNGKILLTSEYLVLDGAKALALPSKFSQSLEINQIEKKNEIKWTSYDYGGEIWFNETFIISENNFSYKGNNKFSDKGYHIIKNGISLKTIKLFQKLKTVLDFGVSPITK